VELRLERPEAKNAIGKGMLQGLRSAIEEVEADAAAKVVLVASSVPKVFCAGADLKVPVASPVFCRFEFACYCQDSSFCDLFWYGVSFGGSNCLLFVKLL